MANDLILKDVHKNLNTLLESKAEALPKDLNKTRFLQNCMTVLQDTKGIEKCNSISVARTMLKGAFLGLDFLNKECYAIPYGNSLQFQTDYKGEVKLAKKYSINPIRDIYAKLVREGDVFADKIENGLQVINFEPIPFNDGAIKGAFAVCYYEDGSMIYETMSLKELEHIRNTYSKQKNGQAWINSTGEMYKKTVLRRLCKNISLDFDSIEQRQVFEDSSDFEVKEKAKAKSILDNADEVEYQIVEEELPDSLQEASND